MSRVQNKLDDDDLRRLGAVLQRKADDKVLSECDSPLRGPGEPSLSGVAWAFAAIVLTILALAGVGIWYLLRLACGCA